ncbi:MAG: aminotransferase class III, partial [Candidatus Muirbacterium halophilum]|nr:aminotransferase class III [Candidatus Muirbacterium halophilum]
TFKHNRSLVLKTLFTQYMLDEGFLATNAFYASLSHTVEIADMYIQATGIVFKKIKAIINEGSPEKYLKSSVCQSGFRRLT